MVRLKLEKTAHQVKMRLDRKRAMMRLMEDAEVNPEATVIEGLSCSTTSKMEGVISVEVLPLSPSKSTLGNTPTSATIDSKRAMCEIPDGSAQHPCGADLERGCLISALHAWINMSVWSA